MKCGIKFCGGCNPRYDRGKALEALKKYFVQCIDFEIAEENHAYDILLVIGGCTNCCASYEQYHYQTIFRLWDEEHLNEVIEKIENSCKEE